MEFNENNKFFMAVIGVFVVMIVGFELMNPVFSQLNTAYTSTYVNGTTAIFNNNQPFISLAGLGYILAVVFVPLALLGLLTIRSNKTGLFDMSEMVSKIIMILVLIFVATIVYLLLLPIVSGAYTSVNGFTWAKSYLPLITLSPLLFILGIAVMIIFEGVSILKDVA
jgi:hypothetical protein